MNGDAAAERPGLLRAARGAAHLSRLALGGIFLAAGVLKSLDVAEFAHEIATYGLFGKDVAALAAPLVIAIEITLAVALLAGFRARAAAVAVGGLLVVFMALEGYGMAHGRTESCGCFGAYVQRTPKQVIGEDALFLLLAVVAAAGLGAWRPRRGGLAAACVIVAAGGSSLFALASPRLPIDRLVTSLRVGRSVEELGIAAKLPADAAHGDLLVALLDVADPEAKETATQLNALADSPGHPRVVALTPSSEQEQAAFLWQAYPAFDVIPVDRPLLKKLYRRLPLYFLVRDGRVARVFRGPRPPDAGLLSSAPS